MGWDGTGFLNLFFKLDFYPAFLPGTQGSALCYLQSHKPMVALRGDDWSKVIYILLLSEWVI